MSQNKISATTNIEIAPKSTKDVVSKMDTTKHGFGKHEIEGLEKETRIYKILPGLWLGNKQAFDDEQLLHRHNISYVISVMPTPDDVSDEPDGFGPVKNTESYETLIGLHQKRLVIPVWDCRG